MKPVLIIFDLQFELLMQHPLYSPNGTLYYVFSSEIHIKDKIWGHERYMMVQLHTILKEEFQPMENTLHSNQFKGDYFEEN